MIDLAEAEEGENVSEGEEMLLFVIERFIGIASVVLLRSGDGGGSGRPRIGVAALVGSRRVFSAPATASRFRGGGIGGFDADMGFESGTGESACTYPTSFDTTFEAPRAKSFSTNVGEFLAFSNSMWIIDVIPPDVLMGLGDFRGNSVLVLTTIGSSTVPDNRGEVAFCSNILTREVVGAIGVASVGLLSSFVAAVLVYEDSRLGLGGTAGVLVAAVRG